MKKLLFFSALCAFLLCGCSESSTNSSSGLQKSNFFAMDTSIEFNIYGDGVYESDSPLGPFHVAGNNPYSYKPGGFLRGAGHGSTMEDKYENLWHTATMQISKNHNLSAG